MLYIRKPFATQEVGDNWDWICWRYTQHTNLGRVCRHILQPENNVPFRPKYTHDRAQEIALSKNYRALQPATHCTSEPPARRRRGDKGVIAIDCPRILVGGYVPIRFVAEELPESRARCRRQAAGAHKCAVTSLWSILIGWNCFLYVPQSHWLASDTYSHWQKNREMHKMTRGLHIAYACSIIYTTWPKIHT